MEGEKIKYLDELLKTHLGEDVEIVDTKLTNLTAPGENYMSDVLKLDVTVRNKNGDVNIEHYVAKCVLFDPNMPPDVGSFMFKSEILFYKEIIPTIQQFAKERGLENIDFFPEFIAARLNLDGKEDPDADAVLIMENLVEKGYENADRHESFDLAGAKLVLSDLAAFHAIPLAIKILNPKLFEEKIANNCIRLPPPPPPKDEKGDKMKFPSIIDLLRPIAKEDTICRAHIKKLEKLVEEAEESMKKRFDEKPDYTSPFLTLCHFDFWLNNTMQFRNEDQLIKNKLVDFQMFALGDPTMDLIFFLFSSVNLITIENHFDYLLMFYHECFIKILEKCKCDVAPFAYDKFMKNVEKSVKSTFIQITMMSCMVIYAKKGEKTDMMKMGELKPSDVHPVAKTKFILLFKKIIENDWF